MIENGMDVIITIDIVIKNHRCQQQVQKSEEKESNHLPQQIFIKQLLCGKNNIAKTKVMQN